MNDSSAKESSTSMEETAPLPIVNEPLPLDILSRQELVDRIFNMLKMLSDARSSYSLALNGKWGSGKTFILEMLERQLCDYRGGEQFMVFHYNCWQYDYYEEPLTAIVAAMLDNIDKYVSIFSHDIKEKARLGFSKTAQEVLKQIASSFFANKIGIDANCVSEIINGVQEDVSEGLEASHDYDGYYAFKKVIENAKKELTKLAEQQTLIIVVDELDRCPPNYAIKTLERLHHLFADLNNTIVLTALDKTQLENTIKMIFGADTDCNAYLKKFIDFELTVDVGTVNEGFFKKYSDYVALFDKNALAPWTDINQYISLLFSQIEIRRQEHLVRKIQMIHQLLFGNQSEKKDYSFLCFELLMGILSENADIIESPPLCYRAVSLSEYDDPQYVLKIDNCIPATLKTYIEEAWTYPIDVEYTTLYGDSLPSFQGALDIPLLLIGYSESTFDQVGLLFHYPEYNQYISDFKSIWELLKTIK